MPSIQLSDLTFTDSTFSSNCRKPFPPNLCTKNDEKLMRKAKTHLLRKNNSNSLLWQMRKLGKYNAFAIDSAEYAMFYSASCNGTIISVWAQVKVNDGSNFVSTEFVVQFFRQKTARLRKGLEPKDPGNGGMREYL